MKCFWILLIAIATLCSSCAFTPQAVSLRPNLQYIASDVGNKQLVRLTVVDERPRSTLGTRGVQGVGAELTLAGNFTDVVQKTLDEGIKRHGFTPSAEDNPDGRELRVEIRSLDYRIVQGFWAGTLTTECSLKAICLHGDARPYEKLYRGELQESVQMVQSAEANERFINTAVSKAINSLLVDSNLTQCLAQ